MRTGSSFRLALLRVFSAVVVPQLASQLETLAAGVTKVSSKVVPISEVDLQVGAVLVDL